MNTKNDELFARAQGSTTATDVACAAVGHYSPPAVGFATQPGTSGNIGSAAQPYPTSPISGLKRGG